MQKTISVIVPAYNCAPFLTRCVESLLAQTFPEIQIIVVDDGSEDNTLQVLRPYEDRIQVIHQKNAGVTAARLRGVSASEGDFIGFVDADDLVKPWMYERLLKNALTYHADISHCGFREIYPNGRADRKHNTGLLREQNRLTGLEDLLQNTLIEPGLCTKLFKRELFEGISSKMDYTLRNNEDMLMNYYLFSAAEKAVYEDVDPYEYRIREVSASRGKIDDSILYAPIRVRKIILEDCAPELKPFARESLAYMTLFSYRILVAAGKQRGEDGEKLLRELKSQKEYRKDLKKKTALQAMILCTAPGLYGVLCKTAQKILCRQ